jgi:DNA invertase Pin-like site-specific DNA recombinase
MKIGYARVSTDDQNPDLQLTALKRAGCDKIFTDKATGTNAKRPALTKCLKALKADDVLTVWKLDRLGRSLRDLIALLDDLKAQGVAFQSLTEAIDTETPTGRAMWQMVGILAELERSLIQERTKAGRAAAVARGVRMGRKRLLSAQQVAHARKLIEQGEGPNKVAKSLNVSRANALPGLSGSVLRKWDSIIGHFVVKCLE